MDHQTDQEPPQEPVLEFAGVGKSFVSGKRRTDALVDLSFSVRRGRVTGLVGPDAAGKTTLMRLAAGLMQPDSGRVTVLGIPAGEAPQAVQSAVAYMPQRFGLYEDLTVQENLDLFADLQGVSRTDRPERYGELLRMTGLAAFTRRLAGRLSGGMKQKLGLACSLLRSPELLMLDEPTVGIDPVSRRDLWTIVRRLVRDEGSTILLSTSYLDEADRCDEVLVLHEGRLIGSGTPASFRSRVDGRTFALRAARPGRRRIQQELTLSGRVADAVLQADSVRVVTREPRQPDGGTLVPDAEGVEIEPVPPRFEDSFVALLKRDAGAQSVPPLPPAPPAPEADDDGRTVIGVHDLKKRFGGFYAVKGISFDVARGEVFGLLGANGAGKTTTFRMLCGLLPATEGRLHVAGLDLRHAAAAARGRIGYMSQKFSLYGDLSVRENLRFFSRVYGLKGRRRAERTVWAEEQFGFGNLADATSRDLPLGYKQRLAMACALMHEPEIIFLDEPTSGVDPLARREFWTRINALAERGVTVMVTTHFMEEAEYCDRLAIMSAGRILAIGTPAEVRGTAATDANPHPTMEDAFVHLIETDSGSEATVEPA
jgi:ABC-2 type transport system ATP-binding protein